MILIITYVVGCAIPVGKNNSNKNSLITIIVIGVIKEVYVCFAGCPLSIVVIKWTLDAAVV